MGILRSEHMAPGVLVLPAGRAKTFLGALGLHGHVEFQDMKQGQVAAPRPYKTYIQRLDELERLIRFLTVETKKFGFASSYSDVDGFLEASDKLYRLDEVEKQIKATYQNFVTFKSNDSSLVAEKNAAVEERWVVETSLAMFGVPAVDTSASPTTTSTGLQERLLTGADSASGAPLVGGESGMSFANIAGVLAVEDEQRFARFLFRMSRGNTYTNFCPISEPIIDPKTGKSVKKSVFVVFFQDLKGSGSGPAAEGLLRQRILRACTQFGVNQYDWPYSGADAQRRLSGLVTACLDKELAQQAYSQYATAETARLLCETRTGNSLLEDWRLYCMKEKAVFGVMNGCDGDATLRVNCWYPVSMEEELRTLLLKHSTAEEGAAYLLNDKSRSMKNAPTYFRTNEFIAPFQELVNTYGVPGYREASPVPFTAVTFPFIFGVMYGDVGHGSIVLLFALWCCYNSENLKKSQPGLYGIRYLLVFMGVFATYAGFLYNDFFSLGMNLFGSRWATDDAETDPIQNYYPLYDIKNTGEGDGPYPFGIDPAWIGAQNELLFLNGLKMKMAVLFGVAQMTMGVMLKWSNAIYNVNFTDFFCECIPMLIFMLCFFGYMDFMILYKWVTPLDNPPSLINSLISMAMGQQDDAPLWDGVIALEGNLMIATAIAVPWLLFPKIIVLYIKDKAHQKKLAMLPHDKQEALHEEHHHEFAEEAIEQVIFTIEYVLGTVSHTASYLRMWALSLAHQQLSLVFFQKTLTGTLTSGNPVAIYFGFSAWLLVTFAVLLCMDSLECFLHTLRLHWVEFQSKFFGADGRAFAPFSHKTLLSTVEL